MAILTYHKFLDYFHLTVDENSFLLYFSCLIQSDYKPKSILDIHDSLRQALTVAGHPDYASSYHAKLLLDSLKEIRTEHILNPDRQPIIFNVLKSLIDNIELVTHSNYQTVVLKAIFSVLYSRMLRPGEVLLMHRNSSKEVPTQIL